MYAKERSSKWRRRGFEAKALSNNDIEGTGTQLTQAELDALAKKYGIPVSANIIPAITENLQAFITNAIPSINVIPVGKANKHCAYVWRDTIKGTMYNNQFNLKQEQAVDDMVDTGQGVLHIRPNNFFSHNEFNCVIQSIPWNYVYIDPNSIEPDYQDAEYIFVAYPMPRSKAKKVWGLTDEDMKTATSSAAESGGLADGGFSKDLAGNNGDSKGDPAIWVIEAFEKEIHTLYINSEGKRSFTQTDVSDIVITAPYIKRSVLIGRYIQNTTMLPITKYPFGFYTLNHNRNPMPYGVVHLIADLQYAINKFIALTIENAQKGSNFRWIYPSGSINDPEAFEQQASRPGAGLEYDANPNLPDGGKPTAQQPMPLASAWYSLMQTFIELSKYITGVFDLNQGNATNAPTTLGATNSIQNAGAQRPKMYARRLDYANQNIFDVLIEYLQAYAPQENIIRYIESGEAFTEIVTDVRASVQDGGQPQADPAGQQFATFVYNEAIGQVKAILGSTKTGQYRVQYQSSNNTTNTRQMALSVMQVAMSGIADDNTRLVMTRAMLELVDYPEVDKVLRDADAMQRLQDTVNQLTQQLEQATKENQMLQKEVLAGDKREVLSELENKVDKLYNKLESEVKQNIDQQKQQRKEVYS